MYYTKKIPLVSLIIVASSQITLASDKKAGLPQLDFDTYPSLIFWSIISLVIGYFLMAYLVTPQIKSIINLRETNIQNDLIKAKTSNEESEKIKNEVSKNQAEIKLSSQTLLNEALLETKKLLDKSEKQVSEKIELRIKKAEQKINETKDNVISEILNNAEDLTKDIVQKFTSIKPLNKDIKKTVDTVSKNILMEK
jgi:F-type H+-transporting ATPase subunit b|tara:strand:- start:452 stop:1039 length:588 start_codon:yes stop_codon:yes gene_type:complete